MIFLKKFSAAVIFAAILTILSGCSVGAAGNSGDGSSAETTIATIEPVTAEPLPDVSSLAPAESSYIYDYANVLTAGQTAGINSYCEKLYKERLINTAVVIADSIGEKTPYEFADDSYNEIYEGRGSGFLLLINNDTGEDCLYRTGSCLAAVPDGAEDLPFFWATKDIVAGDFSSAILRVLQLGERCPEHVFDNIGAFTAEELSALESELSGSGKGLSVLATSNGTDKSNEEICRSYFERHSADGNGYMMMIDTKSGTVTVVSGESLPASLGTAKTAAEKLVKAGDEPGAVREIAAALK